MIKLNLVAAAFVLILYGAVSAIGANSGSGSLDWSVWERLPVYSRGRVKPLATLAAETFCTTSRQTTIIDSRSNQPLTPTALYLTLLFEWSGWDHPRKEELLHVDDVAAEYSFYHQADRWDKTPLVFIEQAGMKQMLGLPTHVEFVAPATLATASLVDPRTQKHLPFVTWGRKLQERQTADETLTYIEVAGLELAQRLQTYQSARMGLNSGILPNLGSEVDSWLSLADLLITKFDDVSDASGSYRRAQELLWQVRANFLNGDANAFNRSSREFGDVAHTIYAAVQMAPKPMRLRVEVAYNRWQPFPLAASILALAVLGCLLALRVNWPGLHWFTYAACGSAAIALLAGITMRSWIAGRPPVTTLYESIIVVATGILLTGIAAEIRIRNGHVLAMAASASLLALMMANQCASAQDSQIHPVEAVLCSHIWLVAHALAATLSYVAFAAATGMANLTLAYYALQIQSPGATKLLSCLTYRCIQAGVILLSCGLLCGCLWADSAGARFWSWDPKETWALITLLCYGLLLHTWQHRRAPELRLAMASASCFLLVITTWLGVSSVFRTGPHAHGFVSGGFAVVCLTVCLQAAYLAFAVRRGQLGRLNAAAAAPLCPTRVASVPNLHGTSQKHTYQ